MGATRITSAAPPPSDLASPTLLGRRFARLRPAMTAWLCFTSCLLVAYWLLWFTDRSFIASAHGPVYTGFEQAFPLADAWLLAAALLAALQLHRGRPSSLFWLLVAGSAGIYLFCMDFLYNLEHSIYGTGSGGLIELAINIISVASGALILTFAWRFRAELLAPAAPRQGSG